MDRDLLNLYKKAFDMPENIVIEVNEAEQRLKARFDRLEAIKNFNQLKVLKAFQDHRISQADFFSATGYGYGDRGREKTEYVFRDTFKAQDCIVRPSIASGTHALSVILFALLEKGDNMLAAGGHPYDTLKQVIGIEGNEPGNLLSRGVGYQHLDLLDNGQIDYERLDKILEKKFKLVELQRSTGYSNRRAFTISELEEAIGFIHERQPDAIIMVDNCYGEFTDKQEPTELGADIMAGSLIKNPGGGIALSGGYIAGRKDLVELCMNHLTAPGLGKDTGLTFGTTRTTLQGFFLAPHITMEALKGALLFASVYEKRLYKCMPSLSDPRSDIIQSIELNDPDKLVAFVRSIQKAASVGSDVVPYPWDMPGYKDKVIMSSGGFVDGSSIEVSCDGPMRPPYTAYYQGGLVYDQAKLACMMSLKAMDEFK